MSALNARPCFVAVIFIAFAGCVPVMGQGPIDVDEQRTKRYSKELEDLLRTRQIMKNQCAAIQKRGGALAQQMQSLWLQSILDYERFLNTAPLTATPILQDYRTSTGRMGRMLKAGQDNQGDLVWCRLQDNTRVRSILAQAAVVNRNAAGQVFNQLRSDREALIDIADRADKNFASLRALADWMGRRSRAEHEAAIDIASNTLDTDPRNAGLALVKASALRSLGEFGDADDLLNEIDDYFLQLQVIHAMVQGQVEFINDNQDRLKKIMTEVAPVAKENGWVEPLLVRGWIALAHGDSKAARRFANEARQVAPQYLEVGVLIAWTILEDTPKKSDDALSLLRDYGVRSSPDDWYYTEALAHAAAKMGNWNQSQKQFEYALETTPSHFQSLLSSYLDDVQAKRVPKVNWKTRLADQWKLPKI